MKVGNEIDKIFGFIAAVRTLVDNYPELKKDERLLMLLNSKSPLDFLMNLAQIIGLTKQDLLNWVSKILCGAEVFISNANKSATEAINGVSNAIDGKASQGVLDIIEEAVKIILLTNVKNLFTCSINPIIPNNVIKFPYGKTSFNGGKGIKLSIPTIDMFNTLQHSPKSEFGKALYFDNAMPSNDLWKSSDFNAFLWFIINKGTSLNNENLKHVWDNRVKYRKNLKNNEIFNRNFFDTFKGDSSYINITNEEVPDGKYYVNEKNSEKNDKSIQKKDRKSKKENFILKKQYVLFEYNETDSLIEVPNTLTLWLNGYRYKKNIGDINGQTIYINKTVFEFNYDYIFSLKLFDSKTIVANIVNAIIGIGNSAFEAILDIKYSLIQEAVAGKVGEIVKKVMEDENTIINDCYFSFSNAEYETLLNETEIKYSNNYHFGDVYGKITPDDVKNITNELNDIGNAATLNEQQTVIQNLFNGVASATASQNGEVTIKDKFTFGDNIIFDLIKESVTQIVLQVLSPKVMILYAINSYFMGDAADGDFSKINVMNLLKGLTNLIINIVKQVLDIIINELLLYLLNELKELLNAILRKIILERLEYYIEIINGLLSLIKMFYNAFKGKPNPDSIIDNVNYADIIPQQNKPEEKTC